MQKSDKKKRKRKRLLDGRQKETRRKTKSITTHRNEIIIQEYFQSILITPHPTKRKRNTIEIEHDECISMTLDTET